MNGHRGSRQRTVGAACLAVLMTGTVPAPAAAAKDDVTLTLKEKVIKNLSSSGLVLAFHVAVANPSSGPRRLVRYRYRVRIDQQEYINTTVALDEPLTVPPEARGSALEVLRQELEDRLNGLFHRAQDYFSV